MTENHIKQLHGTLLKFSQRDEHHRGKYKNVTNHVEAFDEHGRLYVAENRGYPLGGPRGEPAGRITMLEDTDGDGRMETRHEFATMAPFRKCLGLWIG